MTYVTEQMLLDHFRDSGKKLTLDDLLDQFENVDPNEIYRTVNDLVNKKQLIRTGSEDAWILSQLAKDQHTAQIENAKWEQESKVINRQLSETELALAREHLKEYPFTKKIAKASLIISIIAILLTLLQLLLGLWQLLRTN